MAGSDALGRERRGALQNTGWDKVVTGLTLSPPPNRPPKNARVFTVAARLVGAHSPLALPSCLGRRVLTVQVLKERAWAFMLSCWALFVDSSCTGGREVLTMAARGARREECQFRGRRTRPGEPELPTQAFSGPSPPHRHTDRFQCTASLVETHTRSHAPGGGARSPRAQ